MEALRFEIQARDPASAARLGRLILPHGTVCTPAFMPVGTQGAVKGARPDDLEALGVEIVLANTYHLALRPGAEIVREAGGLHGFMGWPRPILTDSGGYQVFSLAMIRRTDDDGVTFRSHIDGREIRLDAETAVRIQNELGADIIMAFDECAPYPASRECVERAVERTTRWAERSLAAHQRSDQALFGIVQGGVYEDLRLKSAAAVTRLDFPGYAIGGVSVGETPREMRRVVSVTAPALPEEKPRYLMGVGEPLDIVDMAALGIDMFDCVIPTRHARNAELYTWDGIIKIRNAAYERDYRPLEADCDCPACRRLSRAYLRHLYLRREILGPVLGTLHNLRFYQRLMARIREAIAEGRFGALRTRLHGSGLGRAWAEEAARRDREAEASAETKEK